MRALKCVLAMLCVVLMGARCFADSLDQDFANPPTAAKPYVWWHWMSNNVSAAGIDKDLEAMKEMGVAGATICEVGSTTGVGGTKIENTPWPDQSFLSPKWWDLVKHAVEKGKELGLDIGMHNCAGWSASGGPWITPELSMQKLVWTETPITGGQHVSMKLEQAKVDPKFNFYRDVTVLVVPKDGDIAAADVKELASAMTADGTFTWEAPAGNWIVYRIGHTTTGKTPHPMPDGFNGLECDKMSVHAATVHMDNVLGPLREHLGSEVGKTFGHILFDSYEAGPQNWTEDFRQQFEKLRGYDPVPWLPVLAGRKIGGDELSKRFTADFTLTITDLYTTNNAAVFHKTLTDAGLRSCFEPYKGFNTIDASAECDTVMGEFWTRNNNGISQTVTAAAQGLGGAIVGAEAFTGAPPESQWTETPASLKPCADGAILSGVNQFYLHDWTQQPFDDSIQPGIAMGWWGTHFGRNQTWFPQGKVFYSYLARCSALLQHGRVVSDFCTLEYALPGGDAISTKLLLDATVEDHQLVTKAGRRYSVLVLPDSQTMLPEIAEKVKELITAGAAVLGPAPKSSPSLGNYPKCDEQVRAIADAVWGNASTTSGERAVGQGKIIWGKSVAGALADLHLGNDFKAEDAAIRSIHRRDGENDIYFLANLTQSPARFVGHFQTTGKVPELWSATDGKKTDAAAWAQHDGRTDVPMILGPSESVIVVFRHPVADADPVATLAMADAGPSTQPAPVIDQKWFDLHKGKLYLSGPAAGTYDVTFASGKSKKIEVPAAPAPFTISSPWAVQFSKGFGAPESMTMEKLALWNQSSNPALKYFSGTATYTTDFDIPAEQLQKGGRTFLDLGRVESLAGVTLNQHDLGVLWQSPFRVEITDFVYPETNHLEIKVTNTWRNRLIGDEQEPADLQWGNTQEYRSSKKVSASQGRPLAEFPDWLIQQKARPPMNRRTFTTWNYFDKDSTLQDSGLVGPVTVQFAANVVVPTKDMTAAQTPSSAITKTEFIFETAPFPSCHASTIAQTKSGLIAAFFGGTRERAPDVGIWTSRNNGSGWSHVVEVANGIQPTGPRLPTWNPVLFQPKNGPLLLFYKVGPKPAEWWGMMMRSDDEGVTWSKPKRLPDGILGPIKDKPIQLADGTIICPSSTEGQGGERLHIEFTKDLGETWTASAPINDGKSLSLIQPTLLDHGNNQLELLCRTKEQSIFESWSTDNGMTWSTPTATTMPNPNSGIDAVQLRDGRSLVVYNPSPTNRYPLTVAISPDGKTWKPAGLIEDSPDQEQLSYPAVIQTDDGMVHITYTWKRKRIRHVVLDPGKLQ